MFAIIAEGKLRQALRQRREVMLREQGTAPEGKRVATVATAAKRGEDGIAVHLQRGADLYRCLRFACGEFARGFYDWASAASASSARAGARASRQAVRMRIFFMRLEPA